MNQCECAVFIKKVREDCCLMQLEFIQHSAITYNIVLCPMNLDQIPY
jgi:hypothetical protein